MTRWSEKKKNFANFLIIFYSAEDALEKQKMIMSSDSSKHASETCSEENSDPTKKLEVCINHFFYFKLIYHVFIQ